LFIDCDPDRPSGVCATGAQLAAAGLLAGDTKTLLREEFGRPDPGEEQSGNGHYLLYAIDLPNGPVSTTLLSDVLKALDRHMRQRALPEAPGCTLTPALPRLIPRKFLQSGLAIADNLTVRCEAHAGSPPSVLVKGHPGTGAIPNTGLVLDQQIIREHLDVLVGVLHLVPFSHCAWPELPVAVRPTAHLAQWLQVRAELFDVRPLGRAVPIGDGVHHEA
jgi:hypothetical protein